MRIKVILVNIYDGGIKVDSTYKEVRSVYDDVVVELSGKVAARSRIEYNDFYGGSDSITFLYHCGKEKEEEVLKKMKKDLQVYLSKRQENIRSLINITKEWKLS